MSDRTEAAVRRQKKKRKRKKIRRLILAGAIIVGTAVNTCFGAINLQHILDEKRAKTQTEVPDRSLQESGNTEEEEAADGENSTPASASTDAGSKEALTEASGPAAAGEREGETSTAVGTEGEAIGYLHENNDSASDPRYMLLGNYENLGVVVNVKNFVNIRAEASADSTLVGKAPIYCAFDVIGEENGFYRIEAGGWSGYVSTEYVQTGEEAQKTAMEHASSNVFSIYNNTPAYEKASTDSKLAFELFAENGYEIAESLDGWFRINTLTGETGYVQKSEVTERYTIAEPFFFGDNEDLTGERLAIVEYAFEWYGGAYVWGGTKLGVGVDCSGYVMRVFEHFGYSVPRLSAEQAVWGKEVRSLDEAKPGDLLFFQGYYDNGTLSEGVGHVAIYIGNGKMIHAASKERGIIVDSYNYFLEPICIRRYIND